MSSSLSSWFVTPNNHISSPSSSPLSPPSTPIGVASYGARAPLDFQLFNFSGHFRVAQTLTFDSMWLPTEKKLYMHSLFVTVYYMNFIIFFCVTLKLFSLSFVPSSHQILVTPLITPLFHFWLKNPCFRNLSLHRPRPLAPYPGFLGCLNGWWDDTSVHRPFCSASVTGFSFSNLSLVFTFH